MDEAIEHISKVCQEENHPVRVDSRITVGQLNKKTKDEGHKIRDVPESQTYSMRWVCKHFGKEQRVCNFKVLKFTIGVPCNCVT